ncbi:MAG: LPS assembly lipoprotein LptE [Pseudohongiella sp.]|nr:LPS assembly lipoprotein LptE [Pseudohongiella sp.]
MRILRAGLLLFLVVSFLSGCGFTLRGSEQAAMPIEELAISYPGGRYPLAEILRDALIANGVSVPSVAGDALELRLSPERLERRALTLNNRGGAGQYALTLQIDASVYLSGQLLDGPETVEVTGSFYEDTANISGSNNGVEQTLNDMRQDMADFIIRRLREITL